MTKIHRNIYKTVRDIYGPKYLALNIVFAVLYYYLYAFILSAQDHGVLLFPVPQYMLYMLVATSSVALTIAAYAIRNSRNNRALQSGATVGTGTTVLGGIVSGCGCAGSFVFSLTAVGVSSTDTILLQDFIAANQFALISAMIIVNAAVSIYYLNKLANPSCAIKKKKAAA